MIWPRGAEKVSPQLWRRTLGHHWKAVWDQMLLRLASERPSEAMGFPSTAVTVQVLEEGGPVREIRHGKWLPCQLKIDFLAYHVKAHPGLLSGDRRLVEGSCQSPRPPESSSVASQEREPPLPFRTGAVPLAVSLFVCRLDMDHGVLFGTFGPNGWSTYLWSIPLTGFNHPPGGWLNFPGPLGLSCGCRAWLMAMAASLAWAWYPCFPARFSLPPRLDLDY